jgi:pimeloyl-ACP methyl ester carboxylesterase
MTDQFAEVAGTQIHYEALGEGTAVILIHAGPMNLGMWDDQGGPFARRHHVIRYDVRGRGQTANPPGQFSDHDDLRGLLNHLDIAQAALVGCSGGAKIALDFAIAYPEMVDKLVLVGPGLGGYEWTGAGFADKADVMRDAYKRGDIEQAAELWTQSWVDGPSRPSAEVDPAVRARVYDTVLHTLRKPEGEGEPQEIDPPAIERLGDIQAPALVILGEHDAPDIHAIVELLMNGIPNARLVEMDDVAHMLNMERPAEFNRLVLDFL